jgi:hypothetical protein
MSLLNLAMKYSKWIGIGAALLLICVCFMPWTYHADVGKNFTGFFSEKNAYGKPGKFFVIFASAYIVLALTNKVWAMRVTLFFAAFMVAYAVKSYILYTSCYNAYCPEKKAGIFLLVFCSLVLLVASLLPDIKIKSATGPKP